MWTVRGATADLDVHSVWGVTVDLYTSCCGGVTVDIVDVYLLAVSLPALLMCTDREITACLSGVGGDD